MGTSLSTGNGDALPAGDRYARRARQAAATAGRVVSDAPRRLHSAAQTLHETASGVAAVGEAAAGVSDAARGAYLQNKGVYELVMKNVGKRTGGGYFGGDAGEDPSRSLKDYRASAAAESKERIVRGLARALKKLGISVRKDSPLPEMAEELRKKLPDPQKQTFKADAEAQASVCTMVAEALNAEFSPGSQLVDTTLGPVSICRQIAELVFSLTAGVHAEFLDVHASLTRVLRNLEVLDEVLRGLHRSILAQLKDGAELVPHAGGKIADFQKVYEQAQKERQRQMALLRNLLDVTLAPAQKELALAMRMGGETRDIIRRLRLVPGTDEFSHSLAMAVSGLGTAAVVSARVDEALRAVDLSVSKYLATADLDKLQEALDSKLMGGSVAAGDVAKFLKAARILKENFYRRGELGLGRGKKKSRGAEGAGEPPAEGGDEAFEAGGEWLGAGGGGGGAAGGAPSADRGGLSSGRSPLTLDRRVALRKMERGLIVKEFIDKTSRRYDALLKAVQELGPRLGRQVPLSSKLEELRDALSRLGQSRLGALNLELALIGYYSDAAAREKKETFLAGLRVVHAVLDEIRGMEMYRDSAQAFDEMHSAISSLVQTIDFYSDVLAKKFGGEDGGDGEDGEDGGDDEDGEDGERVGGVDDDDDDVDPGHGGSLTELDALPEIARSSFDLERAINSFQYFYYVAKVRANLRQTGGELSVYGEKYERLLGDAVAARLRSLTEEHTKEKSAVGGGKEMAAFIDEKYRCKRNFYRALQALDLYMKAFTDGIVSNPDDVQDIKRTLDGVSMIGRWFVEDTGDALVSAFEQLSGFRGKPGPSPVNAKLDGSDEHYYVKVATSTQYRNEAEGERYTPIFVPGDPQYGMDVKNAKVAQDHISKVYDNFQALKDLTNAVARIGHKFGGRALSRSEGVFMSPTQIYKALLEYLKSSALGLMDNPAVAEDAPKKLVTFCQIGGGQADDFAVEDHYFTFCVKAMAAKILTVVGVYDLFERPSPVYELTPTRMIIGGAGHEEEPHAIPEAAELYFRLPRLVEFYKDLFAFNDSSASTQISMLPEMEGVFSGIIRLIFQRAEESAASTGDYSDLEIRSMIREINAIYANFREGGGDAITEALSAFVMEINRRYGTVKQKDWRTLQKLLSESRHAREFGQLNPTNYAILPGEGEYQPKRLAPSDLYASGLNSSQPRLPSGKHQIDDDQSSWTHWTMLKDFRKKLDHLFGAVSPDEFTSFTYSTVIRQAAREMRETEKADGGLKVAARLIQGSGSLAGIDVGKAFMFHETVVVGLNLLNGLYTLLDSVRQRVKQMNVAAFLKKVMTQWADWGMGVNGVSVNVAAVRKEVGDQAVGLIAKRYLLAGRTRFRGRGGAASNLTVDDYLFKAIGTSNAIPRDDGERKEKLQRVGQAVAAFSLNYQMIMGDLLALVSGLSAAFQDLVQVRFPGTATSQLHLNFSGMRSLVQGLMGDVRHYIDLFRPHIAKGVIKQYEEKSESGSLYWLEERLMDGLVQKPPGTGVAGEEEGLDWLTRQINSIYGTLLSPLPAAAGKAPERGVEISYDDFLAAGRGDERYEQYGSLFSKLIFYDGSRSDSPVKNTETAKFIPGLGGIDTLIGTPSQAVVLYPLVRSDPPAVAALYRLPLWEEVGGQGGGGTARSLVILFNQMLAKYISVFYDAASGKIYRNLIDAFANGTFSRPVMSSGSSLPDLGGMIDNKKPIFGQRGDPANGGILFQSLALILRHLVTRINQTTQISTHLVATLSDIPLYLRESFRANLPAFIKLFELIQKKGDFYKQLMAQTSIQMGRPALRIFQEELGGGGIADPSLLKIVEKRGARPIADASKLYPPEDLAAISPIMAAPTDHEGSKLVLTRIIDGVSSGCYSLSNAATEVLRELADEALYLQTHENSIQEYKARYGKLPLMPLSSALTYLGGMGADERLLPIHGTGTEDFKLMYGTRKLLGRPTMPFGLADAPGIRSNLEAYNGSAASREKIDTPRYEKFLSNAVTALRFIVDTRHYQGLLTAVGQRGDPLRVSLVKIPGINAPTTGIIAEGLGGDKVNAVYQLQKGTTPQMTLAITESAYQEPELAKITKSVGGAAQPALGRNRKKEWIYNIIDLNIMPVNVHALMRGIPLAPLYNYVYTFEQMVCLMYGETVERIEKMDMTAMVNTRQLFLKLLLSPYATTPPEVYGKDPPQFIDGTADPLLPRIFRGDSSLMMGRPKFISDQLYNKALFGSLVPAPAYFDEMGPPGSGRLLQPAFARTVQSVVENVENAEDMSPKRGLYQEGVEMRATVLRRVGPEVGREELVTYKKPALGEIEDLGDHDYYALTYLGQPDDGKDAKTALKRVGLGKNAETKLAHLFKIGERRFNTTIVRNLFFTTNVLRVVRLKLYQELTQYRNVIVENHSMVNPSITEYGFIPPSGMSAARRANGPGNEVAGTRQYDSDITI